VPAIVSGNEIPIAPLPTAGTLAMLTRSGEMRPLEEMEIEIIRFAISHYRGQIVGGRAPVEDWPLDALPQAR